MYEAELAQVNGTIKRLSHSRGETGGYASTLIFDYGIDRLTLNKTGLSNTTVDRLYRQFFVATSGFLQTIKECLDE